MHCSKTFRCFLKKGRWQKNFSSFPKSHEDLPRFAFVDESKLRQIFVNLIGNAIKFTDEGGVAVRIKKRKTDNEKSKLIVEIQDSGPGIRRG